VEAVAAAPVKKAPAKAIAKTAEKSAPTQVVNQQKASKPVQKTAPAEKVSASPVAVAWTNADKPPTGKETAAPAKQQDAQEGVAQLLRSQAAFGNKISAEALINERNRGE
jgi:hypothetical protein